MVVQKLCLQSRKHSLQSRKHSTQIQMLSLCHKFARFARIFASATFLTLVEFRLNRDFTKFKVARFALFLARKFVVSPYFTTFALTTFYIMTEA